MNEVALIIIVVVVIAIVGAATHDKYSDIKDPDFKTLLKICDECVEQHKFAMPDFTWLILIFSSIIVIVIVLPLMIFLLQNSNWEFWSFTKNIDLAKLEAFISERPIQILLYVLPACLAVMYGISISARKSAHSELIKLHLFKLGIIRLYLVSTSAVINKDSEIRSALLQGAFDVNEKQANSNESNKQKVETNIPSVDLAIRLAAKMTSIKNNEEISTKSEILQGTSSVASSGAPLT